jgi:hypothetical protein
MWQGLMAMPIHGGERAGAIPWRLVPLVTSLALAASLAVAADAADPRAGSLELQVKAAFLYNFAKFVEWPSDTRSGGSSGSLAFCVFGDEPLFTALTQSLVGKTINGRALVAVQAEGPQRGQRCDIAFIGVAEKKRMDEVLDGFAGAGVLSISDLDQFARHGGMIELTRKADKIRFAVNIDAVNRNGVRISSKLLQLAEVVHQSHGLRSKP